MKTAIGSIDPLQVLVAQLRELVKRHIRCPYCGGPAVVGFNSWWHVNVEDRASCQSRIVEEYMREHGYGT